MLVCYSGGGGLIPAGAGNIMNRFSTPKRKRAHPRGCGEHLKDVLGPAFSWGSSPRVRGTSRLPFWPNREEGLIPAGAGNIGCNY